MFVAAGVRADMRIDAVLLAAFDAGSEPCDVAAEWPYHSGTAAYIADEAACVSAARNDQLWGMASTYEWHGMRHVWMSADTDPINAM